jgi:hypothetical protein
MKSDEKICPQCAETIKKAALVCKYCGHQFSAQDIAEQRKRDSRAGNIGCLGILGIIALIVSCSVITTKQSTNSSSASLTSVRDESETIAEFQVAAKTAITSILKDPDSARYQDVLAHALPGTSGGNAYVFCGLVNSKNGFGGYTGFKRFVACPGVAVTEEADGFEPVWKKFCSNLGKGVWF